MSFRISALPTARFKPLFALSDEELAARGAKRLIVDKCPGFPCRVSLMDAQVGEVVLLTNYEHQTASSPYRAAHAIFVRENAHEARPQVDEVPQALRSRLLSVRGFDGKGMMIDADESEDGSYQQSRLKFDLYLGAQQLTGVSQQQRTGIYIARQYDIYEKELRPGEILPTNVEQPELCCQ